MTIMFTMRNGSGTKTDKAGGHWNEPFHLSREGEAVSGVLLHHCTAVNPFTLGIAVRERVSGRDHMMRVIIKVHILQERLSEGGNRMTRVIINVHSCTKEGKQEGSQD